MKTPRETSPYTLMQEEFRDKPWHLLVGCICLNQVSAKVARPVWEKIFERWPSWSSMLGSKGSVKQELTDLLRPLGFQNRRADRILRMTEDIWYQYVELGRDRMEIDPLKLYGCGKYAADSYNTFVKGELVEDVQDKELKNYLEWAKKQHERTTEASHPGRTDI